MIAPLLHSKGLGMKPVGKSESKSQLDSNPSCIIARAAITFPLK